LAGIQTPTGDVLRELLEGTLLDMGAVMNHKILKEPV
jgi:hypothetical protein